MDPKQLREALQWWRSSDDRISPNITNEGISHVAEIVVDAEWLLGLVEDCENCDGTGWIPDECGGRHIPDMSMSGCPACHVAGETGGRGFSLNQERLERAARALRRRRFGEPTDLASGLVDSQPDPVIEADAESAILAFLFGDSTETRQEPTTNPSHSDPALVVETRQEGTGD